MADLLWFGSANGFAGGGAEHGALPLFVSRGQRKQTDPAHRCGVRSGSGGRMGERGFSGASRPDRPHDRQHADAYSRVLTCDFPGKQKAVTLE